MRYKRFASFLASSVAAGVFVGSGAAAPDSASCAGQFFSSHAGSGAEGITVGGFVGPTAQELRRDFGQTIADARELPREDCDL